MDNKLNFCVDSWSGIDPIRDRCPFKISTGYNLRMRTTGKLHVVIVDDQIMSMLLCSVSEIYIPIHMLSLPSSTIVG